MEAGSSQCIQLPRETPVGEGYKDIVGVCSLQLSLQPKTIHYSHPCFAIICSHTETTPTHTHCKILLCTWSPSSCSIRLAIGETGRGTQTTLITHMHVTHSMKPSADPPPPNLMHTLADSAWSAGPRHSERMSGRLGDRMHGSREMVEW